MTRILQYEFEVRVEYFELTNPLVKNEVCHLLDHLFYT